MVRRKLILLVPLLIGLASARAQEFAVSDPPAGYTWAFIPNTSTALLRPDGWFLMTRVDSGTVTAFVTRENLQEAGQFQTGLTFNFVRGVSEIAGVSAATYALAFVQEAQRTKEVVMEPWANELAPGLFGLGVRYRETTEGNTRVMIHTFLIADDSEDDIRFFIFESPEIGWDEAWKIGEVLMRVEISRPPE